MCFTGGVGIADQWRGHARNKTEWRDTHYRVQGPGVAQMQSVGSTNFDNRSFRLSDEANLNVLNAEFGRAQHQVFEAD